MRKERHEESAEALAGGFSEERQVHQQTFVDVVVSASVIAVAQETRE